MTYQRKIILFTDLDGTLLDAHTYSPEQSKAALKRLQSKNVSIVFCSSKTYAEQKSIRNALGITDPFIVANGSAIVIPKGSLEIRGDYVEGSDSYRIVLGISASQIRMHLRSIAVETGLTFESFADLALERVAALTGLSLEAAHRARQRDYSMTIVTQFDLTALETFRRACERYGLAFASGGRFITVTGANTDKGKAVKVLTDIYRTQYGEVLTVGIGDSQNDIPMLKVVDDPYLVKRPEGTWQEMNIAQLHRIDAIGPLGFTRMVENLLKHGGGL
jgi:mannosyl-3-phosphoglycerate phosphatase family protein